MADATIMKKIGAILVLAGLVSAVSAQTNAPGARSMTLQDCIQEALKYNFDVRVQRYQPAISLYELYVAYATGYDPTFTASGLHNFNTSPSVFTATSSNFTPAIVYDQNSFKSGLGGTLPWGLQYGLSGNLSEQYGSRGPGNTFDSSSGSIGVNLTQPLLKGFWIDNTRLQITAAKNQVKYSEQGLRLQLITSISAVENAYYELIYARENLKVQQEALELGQTQLDQDRQRVQIGSVAERAGTLEQDESQVAQDRANLIQAQYTLKQDENTLKNLITDNYQSVQAVEVEPSETLDALQELFDVQDSWLKGLASRPDLLQAKITLEQQGIQLKFDRNQIYPELDLVGSFGYNGAGKEFSDAIGQINEGNSPTYSYGAQLSVPLSNAKARDTMKADKAVEAQDLLKLKQLEQNVMVEIDNAVKNAQATWESVDATKEARVYAQAALDAEQKKYAVGKSTTFTDLQLQNNLTAAKSQEIRALANYQEALTGLAQQEGSTLERRKVDVTVK